MRNNKNSLLFNGLRLRIVNDLLILQLNRFRINGRLELLVLQLVPDDDNRLALLKRLYNDRNLLLFLLLLNTKRLLVLPLSRAASQHNLLLHILLVILFLLVSIYILFVSISGWMNWRKLAHLQLRFRKALLRFLKLFVVEFRVVGLFIPALRLVLVLLLLLLRPIQLYN